MASIHVIVERVYRGPSAHIDLGGAEGRARARSSSDYNVANADAPARRQSRVTANRARAPAHPVTAIHDSASGR